MSRVLSSIYFEQKVNKDLQQLFSAFSLNIFLNISSTVYLSVNGVNILMYIASKKKELARIDKKRTLAQRNRKKAHDFFSRSALDHSSIVLFSLLLYETSKKN